MRSSGVYFSELRLRLRSMAGAKVSWALVAVLAGIAVLVELSGGVEGLWTWFQFFGLSREGLLGGKLWQLATYGLLHGGFAHVFFNALCVILVGSRIEHMLGGVVLLKTMLGGVLLGGISHVLLTKGGGGELTLVGASGGCVALLLLLTTLSPDSKMWPLPVSARSLGMGVMAAELLLALMAPQLDLPGLSSIGRVLSEAGLESWFVVSHACHFGGGLAGILIGSWMLRPRITTARLRRDRERRESRIAKSAGD